jgi:putative ABC transport system permease protein
MRAIWAAAFLLRRLRGDVGVALMVFVLVALTAFLFAAAPRLFNVVADDGLRHELEAARAVQRNLQFSVLGPGRRSADPVASLDAAGRDFLEEMPESVSSVVNERSVVVDSVRFAVVRAPNLTYRTTFVSLRYQDGLDEAIELVEGRWPGAHGVPLPAADYGFIPEDWEAPEVLARVDIAISDAAAQSSGLRVGDVLRVQADGTDPMLPRAFAVPLLAEFEVVGIFTVRQPDAEVWYGDPSMQVMDLGGSDDNPIAFVTALVAGEAYNDLVASELTFLHEWRFFVDPERIDSAQVDALLTDLRRMQSRFLTSSTTGAGRAEPVLRTAVPDLLRSYLAKRSASEAVLSVAAIGPLVLAAGAVGMVGILLVARRRQALALTRGRGASGLLLIGAQLWEALLLAGVAGLAGLLAATIVVPGRPEPLSAALALAVVGAAVGALVAATWPAARRPLRELHGDERPVARPSGRRLVLEATAVVVAVGGVLLLRQRGLAIEEEQVTRFDPLLAATPALAGVAMGIVAMRLYPLPIRFLGWLAARRRDLVPVLGLRTVARHPAASNLPLLVLMLTAAFGAFASVVTTTIDRGQLVASWENVGADWTIQRAGGGAVSTLIDPREVDGVEAVAGAFVDGQARFASTPNQRSAINLYAIEADAYRDVVAGAPIDAELPPQLDADEPYLGTPESPIPAVLSRSLPAGSQPVQRGDTFTVEVAGQEMTFVDVQERTDFPGLDADLPFVIASLDHLQAAYEFQTLYANRLLVRGPESIDGAMREHVAQELALAQLTSRHADYRNLRSAPLVSGVVIGFRGALAVAAGYTALATMAALTLSAAARTRDLAFLRTLGLSARQSLQLTVMEHGPPVVVALVPGVVLGVALALFLAPSLGLPALAASQRQLDLAVDWWSVAAMSAMLLVVVSAAIAVSTWLARRARAADALRIGDD